MKLFKKEHILIIENLKAQFVLPLRRGSNGFYILEIGLLSRSADQKNVIINLDFFPENKGILTGKSLDQLFESLLIKISNKL